MTFQVSDTSARRSRKHVHLTRQPPLAVLRPPGRGRIALRVVHKGVVRRRASGRRLRPLLVEGVRGVLGDGGGERRAGHAALVRLVAYARVDNCRLSLDDGGRAGEDRVEVICARWMAETPSCGYSTIVLIPTFPKPSSAALFGTATLRVALPLASVGAVSVASAETSSSQPGAPGKPAGSGNPW